VHVCGLDTLWGVTDVQRFDERDSIPGRSRDFFLFATSSRPIAGLTQPVVQGVPGAVFLEIKEPKREADHSPSCSAEVRIAWSYTSTLHTSSRHGAELI